jgi:hypothetical protein
MMAGMISRDPLALIEVTVHDERTLGNETEMTELYKVGWMPADEESKEPVIALFKFQSSFHFLEVIDAKPEDSIEIAKERIQTYLLDVDDVGMEVVRRSSDAPDSTAVNSIQE